MTGVTLKGAIKRYGQTQVIHGIDLEIEDGEFCVFVGPSGCGKSTLLRMIAGLEETSEGEIHIGSREVTHMDPAKRGVAMVFQTYALYPHMSVAENMGFGLRMNGVAKPESQRSFGNPETGPVSQAQTQSTVGWATSACRHWARHCPGPRGVFVRRTAFQP
jgi:lactose/L-arabinose transport system ATP-binding protein